MRTAYNVGPDRTVLENFINEVDGIQGVVATNNASHAAFKAFLWDMDAGEMVEDRFFSDLTKATVWARSFAFGPGAK